MHVYFNSRLFSFTFKFETIKKQRGQDVSARCARVKRAGPQPNFYPDLDANGLEQTVYVGRLGRPAGDALTSGWHACVRSGDKTIATFLLVKLPTINWLS
jgi:hypothetical protein